MKTVLRRNGRILLLLGALLGLVLWNVWDQFGDHSGVTADIAFKHVHEPTAVSADAAEKIAVAKVESRLVSPATQITTELVRYWSKKSGVENRLVWKVEFSGTAILPAPGDRDLIGNMDLNQAVVWAIIDAQSGEEEGIITFFGNEPAPGDHHDHTDETDHRHFD